MQDVISGSRNAGDPPTEDLSYSGWPAPQCAYEERYWDTDLKEQRKITQGQALEEYYLKRKNLDGLECEQREYVAAGDIRHYYLYKETDVLRRAWHRYGGPDGFWNELKEKRNALLNDPGKLRTFDEHPVRLPPRQVLRPHQGLFHPAALVFPISHALCCAQSVYDKLGLYRYTACVQVLEDTEDGIVTATATDIAPVTDRPEACTALEAAVEFFAAYPVRPETPLRLGTSRPRARAIKEVRAVLSEAPMAPVRGAVEWGTPVEKLDFVDEPCPGRYEWNAMFLERVFQALCTLIERDPSTWETIRWEVYNKYLTSISLRSVLRYDAFQLLWFDIAAEWLAAQLPPDHVWRSLRCKCASGLRYDELLGERVSRS